ncbi:DoxX family protein [uncultured Fibrella sp.]|uniref:DoxX family protein n=1 Tax=uncultured Fibrella sp. TaxID=1284596 RepID=UPI0035CBFB51
MSDVLQRATIHLTPYAVLFIRLAFGMHLILYSYEDIFSLKAGDNGAPFLAQLGFPLPYLMAWLYVSTEFLGGLSLLTGFKTRWFSLPLILLFLVAIFVVHWQDPYSKTFDALHMLAVSFFFLFNGSGVWSVDSWLAKQMGNS